MLLKYIFLIHDEYTENGWVDIDLRAENLTNKTVDVVISIKDTGKGIAEDEIKRIFGNYSRVEDRNATIEGTGLGLAVVAKLLYLQNGSIQVKSELGKGSCFAFRLTYELAPIESSIPEPLILVESNQPPIPSKPLNILIAEVKLIKLKIG